MRFLHDWRDLRKGDWLDLYKAAEGVTTEEFENDPSLGRQVGSRKKVLYKPDDADMATLGDDYDTHPANNTMKGRYQIDADSISRKP